jgi:hypothetical protein
MRRSHVGHLRIHGSRSPHGRGAQASEARVEGIDGVKDAAALARR